MCYSPKCNIYPEMFLSSSVFGTHAECYEPVLLAVELNVCSNTPRPTALPHSQLESKGAREKR